MYNYIAVQAVLKSNNFGQYKKFKKRVLKNPFNHKVLNEINISHQHCCVIELMLHMLKHRSKL